MGFTLTVAGLTATELLLLAETGTGVGFVLTGIGLTTILLLLLLVLLGTVTVLLEEAPALPF